jgi:hypothetical protein
MPPATEFRQPNVQDAIPKAAIAGRIPYLETLMTFRSIALATATISLLAFTAAAADESSPPSRHQACKADVERLCAGVEHGGGRIKACMKAHADQVSPDCRSALAQAHSAHRAEHQADAPPAPQ